MEDDLLSRAEHYSTLRTHHPAWLLLASLYAPLVLSSLRTLFEHGQEGIDLDDALHSLAQAIANNADQEQSQAEPGTELQQANRELGEWIKRRLIVERNGRLYATDALESAFRFVDSLDDRVMTSTASRLSVVQREIENLETNLNSDPKSRALSSYRGYSRAHVITAAGKIPIQGSSDPSFRGDSTRWNPEELLLASLSACHKLWYLGLCAEAGVVVVTYEDNAQGTMVEESHGAGQFTSVVLRPRVVLAPGSEIAKAQTLHQVAHEKCFIARSVNFPVSHAPDISVVSDA